MSIIFTFEIVFKLPVNDDNSHTELIEKGIAFLNDNNRLAALACFDKAFVIGKSPELLSYLSYCIATERGQIYEALKLCNDALSQEPDNPVHYLNLGRIYLHAGKKDEALLDSEKRAFLRRKPDDKSRSWKK